MAIRPPVYEPFGRDTWRDPFTLYRRLREEDPVHESPRGFWVLTRFQHVFDAVKDTATFSSASGLTFQNEREQLAIPPTIVMMDPPEHTRYRRLVDRGFTPRRTTELEPALRRFVIDRIEALKKAGEGDFVSGARAHRSELGRGALSRRAGGRPTQVRGMDAGLRASQCDGRKAPAPARRSAIS